MKAFICLVPVITCFLATVSPAPAAVGADTPTPANPHAVPNPPLIKIQIS